MIRKRLMMGGASAVLTAAGSLAYMFEGEMFTPYVDPVGVLTVCVGDTQAVELGKLYSERECTERFIQDLRTAHADMLRCTPGVPDGMQPALVSFTFNVGGGNYCSSTLARKVNAGDYIGACNELPRWVYAKKQKLPGLVTRREAEKQSCLNGLPWHSRRLGL